MTVLALIASACGSGADEQQEPAPAFGGVLEESTASLDSSGDLVWAKSFGDTSSDGGYSVAVDSSGNVYTTG